MFRRKYVASKPTRKIDATLDKDLEVIYGSADGEPTDFTKLEMGKKKSSRKMLLWLALTAAIVTGAAYGGYVIFERVVNGTSETLVISIDGPSEVKSGEEVQFDVLYQNKGTVPFANLEMKLNIPEGFTITKAEPVATSSPNVWIIGSVTPGSDGLIRLKGIWLEPVPSGQTLQALATYRPANFSADFQDIATKTITINTSVLTLKGEGQATAVPGDDVVYTYTVKNDGKLPINDVRVRVTVPTSFLVNASDPDTLQEGTPEWQIDTLAPDEERTITLSGAFAADATGLQTIQGSIGVMREESYVEQAVADTQTDVIGGGLTLRLIVNGSTETQTVDPGSSLRLSIDVINGSEQAVSGLNVIFNATTAGGPGVPIDWQEADIAGGKAYLNESNEVVWKGSALSGNGKIAPGERETIDFSLPIEATVEAGADDIILTVQTSVTDASNAGGVRSLTSTPLHILINSDAVFSAVALYYDDGTPVGSGSLPPAVGQTTRYRVYWSIDNSLHALDDVTVSATIPPGVSYVGVVETDIGILSFDSVTRTLSWSIDRLPISASHVATSFDLSVTPTSADVGTFIKLSNEATLVGTDSKTQSRLSQSWEVITTELPDDALAAGKGAVVE
ncbi:MAG: hypothetical protein AAB429_00100 [Patescibacteria group bacterium]